jgi:hypothetical protein
MYVARAVKLMIASPSDVATERQIIRDVVHQWNAIHSEDRGVVLMPVGWDTHAGPAMGERPQAIINKQILGSCDVLVAVFWTRIGSPTGAAASGTVEEIEEHVGAGKHAMVYFSAVPVRLDSVEDAQYKALLEFKAKCQSRGLVESYESYEEFREKFARQLAQLVIREYSNAEAAEVPAFAELQVQRGRDPIAESLSPAARELLLEASTDKNGVVMRFRTMEGLGIQTNQRAFVERGDPRSEARWEAALRQLQELGLLEAMGHKGELFKMTDLGYETADRLRGGAGAA